MPAIVPGDVPQTILSHETEINLTISGEEDIYTHLEDLSEQVPE